MARTLGRRAGERAYGRGRTGLRPTGAVRPVDARAAIDAVKDEMLS
jgi:hypothetical protein